jgi:hypothetical protein
VNHIEDKAVSSGSLVKMMKRGVEKFGEIASGVSSLNEDNSEAEQIWKMA